MSFLPNWLGIGRRDVIHRQGSDDSFHSIERSGSVDNMTEKEYEDLLDIPHELLSAYDLETTRGLICPEVIIHEDPRGQTFIYKLTPLQRLFLTVEDPDKSHIGKAIATFMLGVIGLSCLFYVLSSINAFKEPNSSCPDPICNNDPTLCPGTKICEPVNLEYLSTVEMLCVIIFSVEYGVRMLFVNVMPPRLVNITNPKEVEEKISAFDQTKETPDMLLLAQLKYLRDHLKAHEAEIRLDKKSMNQVEKQSMLSSTRVAKKDDMSKEEESRWLDWETKRWNAFSHEDDECKEYSGLRKTVLYGLKILNIVDLLAVLPFYIELLVSAGASVTVIRVLRLVRVFRVFKMGKNSKGVDMLAKTFYNSFSALALLAFFIALGVILFGAVIFFLEQGVFSVTPEYPMGTYLRKNAVGVEEPSPYRHILASCYWAVVVSTTVGFGDLVPTSTAGKCVACLCAFYGVLLLALPITVIGSNFKKLYEASHGSDDESLIIDCLDGISKALYLECVTAEQVSYYGIDTLGTSTQSCIYSKMMGIISTFDSTKQNLIKAAISNANDSANRGKLKKNLDRMHSMEGSLFASGGGSVVSTPKYASGVSGAEMRTEQEPSQQPEPPSASPTNHPRRMQKRMSSLASFIAPSQTSTPPSYSTKRKSIAIMIDPVKHRVEPLVHLNLRPHEAVDLVLRKKKNGRRDLDVEFAMPVEPDDLHLPMPELGLSRSENFDVTDLKELVYQVHQLQDVMRKLPLSTPGSSPDGE